MNTSVIRAAAVVFIASFCTLVVELVAGRVRFVDEVAG